jgi:hypothetical protein
MADGICGRLRIEVEGAGRSAGPDLCTAFRLAVRRLLVGELPQSLHAELPEFVRGSRAFQICTWLRAGTCRSPGFGRRHVVTS